MLSSSEKSSCTVSTEALTERQRFENLVNYLDGIFWEFDPVSFRLTFVSAQAERILGYRIEEWYTDGFWLEHLHPEDRERTLSHCFSKVLAASTQTIEFRMVAADGHVVWFKDTVSIGVDITTGQAQYWCGIMIDITELKNAKCAKHLPVVTRNEVTRELVTHEFDDSESPLIEDGLRLALERNELRVFYQAQLDLVSGQIVGMEALVRWAHPEMGLLLPIRFIPIAEQNGHIADIGLWVLRAACKDTRDWHDRGFGHLRVAVNVSAQQFDKANFAREVKQVLHDTCLSPEQLELELTESLIMQRPANAIEIMDELRAIGVRFSIDDFGTGYSSLSQLKRFPFDKIKIDRSFTGDIGIDVKGTEITRAIIGLGRNIMHMQVVAEGVETEEQRNFLIRNGCHCMQGYLFSHPIPSADFSRLLATHNANLYSLGNGR